MQLCPTQEKALERILALLPSSDVFVLWFPVWLSWSLFKTDPPLWVTFAICFPVCVSPMLWLID